METLVSTIVSGIGLAIAALAAFYLKQGRRTHALYAAIGFVAYLFAVLALASFAENGL